MTTIIAVFGSSTTQPGTVEWGEAIQLGRGIAQRGWEVATGGYGGTMEAVSAGAAAAGGRVVGVTAPSIFPDRQGVNPHVHEEVAEHTISHRIAHLVESTDAAIVLPGSIGTLAELIVAWNAAFVAPFRGDTAKPVVAVGPAWEAIISSLQERLPTGHGFVHLAPNAAAALGTVEVMITQIRTRGR
jgi:uncharacterized protein (TIGR00725 family)